MKFDVCPYCGRHALMKKNVCETCWKKRFFNVSMAIALGKVRFPNTIHFIEELRGLSGR